MRFYACLGYLPVWRRPNQNDKEKLETPFPHYKSMGAFSCREKHSFDPICPKAYRCLSPTPLMLHTKFDQDWPAGLSDIYVWKCKYIRNFWHSTAGNFKVTDPIRPDFELVEDVMPVLVTSQFAEDPIKMNVL